MLLTATLILSLSAGVDLTPEKAAEITNDQNKAQAAVKARFGNKKDSELTRAERTEMSKAQAEAEQKALDKHGVSVKEWARFSQGQGRDAAAAQKSALKTLEAKDKAAADAAAAGKAGGGEKEIQIQRGFSDENPVVLEEKDGAAPRVDTNIAPGELEGVDGESSPGGGDATLTPTKGGKKKGGGKRRR